MYHSAAAAPRPRVATARPASSHAAPSNQTPLQGTCWTVNSLSFIISTPHEVCSAHVRNTFLSHTRELVLACLRPSWPHSLAFPGQREAVGRACAVGTHHQSSLGPTHSFLSGKAFCSKSPALPWKCPHFGNGDQPEVAFEVLWTEAAVCSNFSVLQRVFYVIIGIIHANLQLLCQWDKKPNSVRGKAWNPPTFGREGGCMTDKGNM